MLASIGGTTFVVAIFVVARIRVRTTVAATIAGLFLTAFSGKIVLPFRKGVPKTAAVLAV